MRTKTGRNGGFARQWIIYQTMRKFPHGLSAVETAKLLGVSVRTVYRDFEVMINAGVPLYDYPLEGKRVVYRLMD